MGSTGEATDGLQRLLYDNDDGLLFYDLDGNGAARVLITSLDYAASITVDDSYLNSSLGLVG